MKTIVFLIVGISLAAGIVLAGIFVLLPSSSGSNIDPKLTDQSKGADLYLYLFKENSDLRDSGVGGYYMLHEDMTNGIGQITKPSFEQVHYGIGRDGIYKNWLSDIRIERFSSVVMIISDSIKKPDGSSLKQEDFSPDARFFYSPYFRATLLVENDGMVYVHNQDRYNNPNNLPPERMIGVVTLPVEEVDFERINSNYEEIKERIESYKPRQLQSPPAMILQDESKGFLDNLVLVAETTNGKTTIPSSDLLGGYSYSNDTNGISIRLYHGINATSGAEIVATSLSNPAEGRTISLYQLAISGYVSVGDGSAESVLLNTPIISDQYNAIEPATTIPITIPAGESITAYIQGDSFDVDRYTASACYSYDDADPIDQTDSDRNWNNDYCFNAIQQSSIQNMEYKTRYNQTQIPDLQLIVRSTGKVYAGEEGSYCWGNVCADSIEIVPGNTITIDKGSEIEFRVVNYRQPEEFNVYVQSPQPFVPNCVVKYDNATSETITTCDEPPEIPQLTQLDDAFHYRAEMPGGTYKIFAFAMWQTEPPYSEGDASYYYMIQVK